MTIRQIADPFEDDLPCGKNIREHTSARQIYYQMKDARTAARTAERGVTPGETISLSPSWQEVRNLGLRILSSESKDIEVLAWLAEAQLRLEGFAGLRDVYLATASLLDHHFDALHSIGDDDVEERFSPFAGLNGSGSEGTIIQPIRLTSLLPGGKFAHLSLWDFQLAQRPGERQRQDDLQQAANEAGVANMTAHLRVVMECLAAYERLVNILDARCGHQAPPSSNTRNVLQEVASAIRALSGLGDADPVPVEAAEEALGTAQPPALEGLPSRPTITPDAIRSREEAFELLTTVARYFRRTEPHSPLSMSIDTLVRRGRMEFSELLAELLPEQQTRHAVLTAAGIHPASESKGG